MNRVAQAVLWAAAYFGFTLVGVAMAFVFDFSEADVSMLIGCLMLVSLVVPFTQLSRQGAKPKDIGITRPVQGSEKAVLYYIPALLSALPLLLAGIRPQSFGQLTALLFFHCTLAFSEEVYFRGLIYNTLGQPVKSAVITSAAMFGVAHFGSLLGGDITLLFKAIAFGVVAAELRRATGSIYPAMVWHVIFHLAESLALPTGRGHLAAELVQIGILIAYAAYLWRLLPNDDGEMPPAAK